MQAGKSPVPYDSFVPEKPRKIAEIFRYLGESSDATFPILYLNPLLTKIILYANDLQYILIVGRCYSGQSR